MSLKIVKNNPDANSITSNNKRQYPRFITFDKQIKIKDKVFGICDISLKGLSIKTIEEEDYNSFAKGDKIHGLIKLSKNSIDATLIVKHKTGNLIGLEFQDLAEASSKDLNEYLNLSFLGKSITKVEEDILATNNPLGVKAWYHGKNLTDIFIWKYANGGFEEFQIIFLDQFIEWTDKEGLATGFVELTGHVLKDEGLTGYGRIEELLFKYENDYSKDKTENAVKLVEASNIESEDKKFILARLKNI